MNHVMQEAMRLMREGDLTGATHAIQQGLHGEQAGVCRTPHRNSSDGSASIDGECRVVADAADASVQGPFDGALRDPDVNVEEDGQFRDHHFGGVAGALHYKLFIPAGPRSAAPPLLVMLHGCSQSPDDFARGTRMNDVAQEHGYVVAYPAQAQNKNAAKCWNWFRSQDQQRGGGEAAMIAELTRHLVVTHGLDERRVYVAGLSAGGAMATVLASAYPDVYAAIGVHSGLPFGVAHDLPSAFAAMKQGKGRVPPATMGPPVPAIVFHGDRDTTVDPCNGAAVIAQFTGTTGPAGDIKLDASGATVERGTVSGGRAYTKTTYRTPEGRIVAEQWIVHGAGHAWFGGDRAGSYTDPSGPDASDHMVRFFSACTRGTIN